MSRRHTGVLAAGLVLFALSASAEESIDWLTHPSAGMERARADEKPVLVDFWAVWCQPCKLMDETTYRDPDVIELARTFVPLKIDIDAQASFVERYDADVFPTVLFLDHHGREIGRIEGLATAKDLAERLEAIGNGYETYLATVDRKHDPAALIDVASFRLSAGNAAAALDDLQRALKLLKTAPAAERQEVELKLALASWRNDEAASAAKRLRRLSAEAEDPDLRARALAALSNVERDRGRDQAADEAAARLREAYPQDAERRLAETQKR